MGFKILPLGLVVLAMTAGQGPAEAKPGSPARPEIFQKLLDCKAVKDNAQRLACLDAQLAKLEDAEARKEVVVIDRGEVTKVRRSLFGLSLPNLGLFGSSKDDPEQPEISEIETTIRSVFTTSGGKLGLIVADGAKWVQIDSDWAGTPKSGQPVRIRKAVGGSFFANINGRRAIRMKREN